MRPLKNNPGGANSPLVLKTNPGGANSPNVLKNNPGVILRVKSAHFP